MTTRLDTELHQGLVDASPPPTVERAPRRQSTAVGLQIVGVVVAWVLIYLGFLSGFEQSHAQHRLYDELRTQLALGEAPTQAPITEGTPLATLSIPDAGERGLVVVEGTRNEQLQDGPGHVPGSVLPGQAGTSVVAGRSFTFGGPFSDVPYLPRGAPITVTTVQGTFRYTVTTVRLRGDPRPVQTDEGASRLTLVTSLRGRGPFGWLRRGETVYVDAELDKGAVAAGAVATPDTGTTFMKGRLDVTTLALLALSLQLLLVTVVGSAWAWRRWSRRATWIVAAPALLASAWLASSFLALLLPGLI